MIRCVSLALGIATLSLAGAAAASTPDEVMSRCQNRLHQEITAVLDDIVTKYEGQRTDGTHAVNGTARVDSNTLTFQCSFEPSGQQIVDFVVNEPSGGGGSQGATVAGTEFNATGTIPCARHAGQPMGNCKFGVIREGGGNGSVTVFWPDGGNRVIFFEAGTPISYDESRADGGARMTVGQNADLYLVTIGDQRFEIPDAVISGG